MHSAAPARQFANMSTSKIKLTLMVGAWGKSGPRPGQPLTEAERHALAVELNRRRVEDTTGFLAKARASGDPEWIAACERVLDDLRQAADRLRQK